MRNNNCPECGSSNIQTERRLDGFHHCIDCRHTWKIGESQPKPTVFDRITASPEVLAEKLVYYLPGVGWYFSTLFDGDTCWKTKAEAFSATVARLKELAK